MNNYTVIFDSIGNKQRRVVVKAFNIEYAKIKARQALEETYGQENTGLWLISEVKVGIHLLQGSKSQKRTLEGQSGKLG